MGVRAWLVVPDIFIQEVIVSCEWGWDVTNTRWGVVWRVNTYLATFIIGPCRQGQGANSAPPYMQNVHYIVKAGQKLENIAAHLPNPPLGYINSSGQLLAFSPWLT